MSTWLTSAKHLLVSGVFAPFCECPTCWMRWGSQVEWNVTVSTLVTNGMGLGIPGRIPLKPCNLNMEKCLNEASCWTFDVCISFPSCFYTAPGGSWWLIASPCFALPIFSKRGSSERAHVAGCNRIPRNVGTEHRSHVWSLHVYNPCKKTVDAADAPFTVSFKQHLRR